MSSSREGPADLAAVERLWMAGRPLEAGRALTLLVPLAARPRWAGRIVAWAYGRSKRRPEPAVVALIAATAQTTAREEAVAQRGAVAALLAQTERTGQFDSLHEALLTLALNAARLLLAATSPEPPDPREGWWFVASLKCVGDELDDDFAADAWKLLAQIG